MEDKRIAEICSRLERIDRFIGKVFYVNLALAIIISSYATVRMHGVAMFAFLAIGLVLGVGAFWMEAYGSNCIRVMTRVMEYYKETQKETELIKKENAILKVRIRNLTSK